MSAAVILGIVALAVWLGLILARGRFFVPRLPAAAPAPAHWPAIVAVVPARDEAAVIARAVGSLLAQDYPGDFSIVLVDDHSGDGTAEIARGLAGADAKLRIVAAPPLPHGWTGKLWAMNRGVEEAGEAALILFTDADIAHHPANLRQLAARLEHERRDLVSLMVRLHCDSLAERLLIPAFVFFFAMLYPFAWVADPRRRTAAAAGGCMLIRRAALDRIGGVAAIKSALIDDCALARAVKDSGGAIRLDLTRLTTSIRPYPRLADIWNMIARSAYTQLRYSPALLAGTVAFMALVYVVPPLLLAVGGTAAWLGAAAWLAMSLAYLPMALFYGLSPLWAVALPLTALIYLGATIASAWRHFRGRGGAWKGRVEWRNAR
ncbi:MAG TPA: glycosyltransferase [Stellaceae bacterium]|nr:glycosyltransferase [Stellaceae bacterium]